MKNKTIFRTLLSAAVIIPITAALIARHQPPGKKLEPKTAAPLKIEAMPPAVPTGTMTAAVPPAVSTETNAAVSPPLSNAPAISVTMKQNSGNGLQLKEPVQDPAARAALSFVGADPEAEQYWMAAINDPGLPANERKDLIEDLNEDGLSDPKHPDPQDLPLIWSRIRLIEQLAPDAMDQVNADAFQEAYKDLVSLAAGGTAQ